MAAKFVLKKSKDGRVVWMLKAGNGEVVLQSDAYTNKAMALKGIDSVRRAAKSSEGFERKPSKKGKTSFVIIATAKEVIRSAQTYATPSSAMRGIKSVQKHAPDAPLVDETVVS